MAVLLEAFLTKTIVGHGHIHREQVQAQRLRKDTEGPSCWWLLVDKQGPPVACSHFHATQSWNHLAVEVVSESPGVWFLLSSKADLSLKAVFFL